MITQIDKESLQILAHAIHGTPVASVSEEKWELLLTEYKNQTVWAIPASIMDMLFRNMDQQRSYANLVARNVSIFYRLMEEQSKVVDLFDSSGIASAILKGAAAAVYYPFPEFRCMGDIDIIVCPQDYQQACKLLTQAGYKKQNNLEENNRHIGFKSSSDVKIELHNHFSSSNNVFQNETLDRYIFDAIPRCQRVNVQGYTVPVLEPMINGLVLLGHINQHMSSGLGLRQMIDWMCFVEKHLDDETWKTGFCMIAEIVGMRKLAVISTAMCRKYLGLRGNITWCDELSEEDRRLCDELMTYVMDKGNFGRKAGVTESRLIEVIRIIRKPLKGFKTIQAYGCINWRLSKKYPILRPIAWFYQIYKWMRNGINRKVSLKKITQSAIKERKETNLLKRLGITRI